LLLSDLEEPLGEVTRQEPLGRKNSPGETRKELERAHLVGRRKRQGRGGIPADTKV